MYSLQWQSASCSFLLLLSPYQQMMHLISLLSSNVEHCTVVVCNSLFTSKALNYFFSLVDFFCFFKWISYLCLAHMIDFNNSFFIWMVYGINMKMIFMNLLAIIVFSSKLYFNTTLLSLKPLLSWLVHDSYRKSFWISLRVRDNFLQSLASERRNI